MPKLIPCDAIGGRVSLKNFGGKIDSWAVRYVTFLTVPFIEKFQEHLIGRDAYLHFASGILAGPLGDEHAVLPP